MNRRAGFTLIEVLIASAIFAVVMVALYAAFSSGVFGYRNIDERVQAYQEAGFVLGALDRDLRNSFAYSPADTKFSGSTSEIKFFSLVNDYQGDEIAHSYAFMDYYLDNGKLMRLCRRNQESLKPDSEVKADELCSGVKGISFTYIYLDNGARKEVSAWDDPQRLPVAVKAQISLQKKYAYDFERTIYFAKTAGSSQESQ
jgi:type II secretion system protein J